jgi:hypothetical protein
MDQRDLLRDQADLILEVIKVNISWKRISKRRGIGMKVENGLTVKNTLTSGAL